MRIHFIGIGGIGISALAQYYLAKKARVSGSDLHSSEITEMLKKKGAKIIISTKNQDPRTKEVIKNANLVVYSKAVPEDHPELKLAREFKIKCLSYPEALGELTKKYFTIAICGTHGKSTTGAMIALILIKAGLNPTVILGTKLREFGDSNFRMGKIDNQILVIEADEHFGSFLNYWPKIIVLTNIEKEHLDYYKNLKNLLKAFEEFIGHLPKDGILIANRDDKQISNLKSHISKLEIKIQSFSIRQKEAKELKEILKVPGRHNIYNALAALSCARVLGIPDKISFMALSEYKGAWRRMEEKKIKIKNKEVILISDYGHHPTEIRATIEGIREKYPKKEIWLVFQPHQYQRTYYLFEDFVKTLANLPVKKIIIPPIFDVAGREKTGIKKRVSSQKLVFAINKKVKKIKAIFLPNFKTIQSFVKSYFQGEILIIMGAGDIYNLWSKFST